jgi:hypothetical protein
MKLFIPEGSTHVLGRSREKAAELLEAAKGAGLEGQIATTTDGYIVPDAVLEAFESAKADAEQQSDVDAQAQRDADAASIELAAREAEDAAATAKADEVKAQEENPDAPFDPSEHTVVEVQAYLEGADQAERDRVLAEELTGKARTSLVDNTEGAK